MAKKILRAIDRWRFEAPLSVMLGVAAAFAVVAMPAPIFALVPVAGGLGLMGQGAVAVAVAVLSGVGGYALMCAPSKKAAVDDEAAEEAEPIEEPTDIVQERLLRFRRADRHPDAPPREPIRAIRELGEPMMEVGLFFQADDEEAEPGVILDGEFVELAGDVGPDPLAQRDVEGETLEAVEEIAEVVPVEEIEEHVAPIVAAPPPRPTPRPERQSLTAMIDRLSTGLERRASAQATATIGEAPRDMRPALREALEELNRLAAGRA